MSWGITAIVVGVVAIAGSVGSLYMQHQALEQQKEAQARYEARLNSAMEEAKKNEIAFTTKLEELDQNFDPMQMEKSFTSLYEATIRPLEVDFEQNQLPELRNTFNIGADGVSLNSGNAKLAETNARRDLAFNTATLRGQERDKAITRAYADYDRRVNSLQLIANAKGNVVNASIGTAGNMYGAASDTASATSAFGGAISGAANSISGGIAAGANVRQSGQFVDAYKANNTKAPVGSNMGSSGGGGGGRIS